MKKKGEEKEEEEELGRGLKKRKKNSLHVKNNDKQTQFPSLLPIAIASSFRSPSRWETAFPMLRYVLCASGGWDCGSPRRKRARFRESNVEAIGMPPEKRSFFFDRLSSSSLTF